MNIFLVRHGESLDNDKDSVCNVLDLYIPITPKGVTEAYEVGEFLNEIIGKKRNENILICSPFLRTRQTTKQIIKNLDVEVRYSLKVREFDRGKFGKYPLKQCEELFPDEFKKFVKELNSPNKFHARPPEGESVYDVTLRIKKFLPRLDNLKKQGFKNVVIVTHSGAMRAFVAAVMGYGKDWYYNESGMKNCSVRHIKKENNSYEDLGYIYKGYKKKNSKNKNKAKNEERTK